MRLTTIVRDIAVRVYQSFPGSSLKVKLKDSLYYFWFSHFNKYRFSTIYIDNYFQLKFTNGIILKAHEDVLLPLALTLPGFLAHYELQEGDTVIDCGAHVGAFAIYAAKMVRIEGKVICFEPDPFNYNSLLRNIELNQMTNITAINKGIWSEDTTMEFYSSETSSPNSSLMLSRQSRAITKIPVVSLDSELERIRVKKVSFIKMDIEGAEIEAVKGSQHVLAYQNVNLAIASYHVVNGQKTCFELERLLSKFGYRTHTSNVIHLTTYGTK